MKLKIAIDIILNMLYIELHSFNGDMFTWF